MMVAIIEAAKRDPVFPSNPAAPDPLPQTSSHAAAAAGSKLTSFTTVSISSMIGRSRHSTQSYILAFLKLAYRLAYELYCVDIIVLASRLEQGANGSPHTIHHESAAAVINIESSRLGLLNDFLC
jgi:hypothetical protein